MGRHREIEPEEAAKKRQRQREREQEGGGEMAAKRNVARKTVITIN